METARLLARRRFDSLAAFIGASSAHRPSGDTAYFRNTYSSWVLLTYAGTQAAVVSQGEACVRFLGAAAARPSDLPSHLALAHHRHTLAALAKRAREGDEDLDDAVEALTSDSWSEHSEMLALQSNVWPSIVREWLVRLGVTEADLVWMGEPLSGGSETLTSQIERLVGERNDIAHGHIPENLLDAQVMSDWAESAALYADNVARTMQLCMVRCFPDAGYADLGSFDEAMTLRLSEATIAMAELYQPVSVGDYLFVWEEDPERPRLRRVLSIQSQGKTLLGVPAGSKRVAIAFHRPVPPNSRVQCLP